MALFSNEVVFRFGDAAREREFACGDPNGALPPPVTRQTAMLPSGGDLAAFLDVKPNSAVVRLGDAYATLKFSAGAQPNGELVFASLCKTGAVATVVLNALQQFTLSVRFTQ